MIAWSARVKTGLSCSRRIKCAVIPLRSDFRDRNKVSVECQWRTRSIAQAISSRYVIRVKIKCSIAIEADVVECYRERKTRFNTGEPDVTLGCRKGQIVGQYR